MNALVKSKQSKGNCLFYPFHTDVSILNIRKTSQKLWFSDVFKGYRNKNIDVKWVKVNTKSTRPARMSFWYHFGQLRTR